MADLVLANTRDLKTIVLAVLFGIWKFLIASSSLGPSNCRKQFTAMFAQRVEHG